MSAVRHSGLQKQVLSLYRKCLRAARTKAPEQRVLFVNLIRDRFREHVKVPRADVIRIEYLLRKGNKQLDNLQAPESKALLHH